MFRVGYGTQQIYNGELEKFDISAFMERLDAVLDHCRFMTAWTTRCEVRAVEGANFPVEQFDFPLGKPGVRTLADGLDLHSLLKRIPTLALDFKFITSFDVPSEPVSYRTYIRSIHHIIDLLGSKLKNCPMKFYPAGQDEDGQHVTLKLNNYNPETNLAKVYDMMFGENYCDILMLDNHNTLFRSSRIESLCQQFVSRRDGYTFGGIEKYRYNPYNRKASSSDSDRQVVFVNINFKEDKSPKMEDVLFDIFSEIVRYVPVSALRELTVCLVCRCNKSFDCPGLNRDDERTIVRCNKRVAKEIGNMREGHWQYVSNNSTGSNALINRFYQWRYDGFPSGFYVMLMKTKDRLTNQKVKYYSSESWANAIQRELN